MIRIIPLFVLLLAACTTAEKETVSTSVDVDQDVLGAFLADINGLTGNALPVDEMLELAVSTPMDEELQDRYVFRFNGADEDVLVHTWREQVDWLHLYFSSTSGELIAAIEQVGKRHAR